MARRRITRRYGGFTLIEVLIAVLVLSVGLLGLAGLQATSLRQNHGAYQRSLASLFADDLLDRMRANRSAAIAGAYDISFDSENALPAISASSLAEQDLAHWGRELLAKLPSATASIDVTNHEALIDIQWDGSRTDNKEQASATEAFRFRTRL